MSDDGYLDFVEDAARAFGKLFIIDTGEGRDYQDDVRQWYVEDLSGWLIDPSDQEKFIQSRVAGTAYELFSDAYVFAIWRRASDGQLGIDFKSYPQ